MRDKKILHVVTLLSDRNIYGGPVGVATDFMDAPPEGFEISIFSTYIKGDLEPSQVAEKVFPFRARRLLPVGSFSVLFSLGMFLKFFKSRKHWSLVHIHLARDMVTLPIAFMCAILKIPYVVQTHGMIDHQTKFAIRLIDMLATKTVIRKASAILFLTSDEEASLRSKFSPSPSRLIHLPNAAPNLALSQQRSEVFQVCFVARLHPRKRASDFVYAASKLRESGIEFIIAGHDQGDEEKIVAEIENLKLENLRFLGPVSRLQAVQIMATSHLLVLPSSKEPYPLSVIESLTLGTPVLVTDECGLSHLINAQGGGIVFPMGDREALVRAILKIEGNWQVFHEEALHLSKEFSRQEVNLKLTQIYLGAIHV